MEVKDALKESFKDPASVPSPKGVYIVAIWLLWAAVAAAYGWWMRFGPVFALSAEMALLGGAIVLSLLCALGLFFYKEWARRISIWLFAGYGLWALYVTMMLIGPELRSFALWLAEITPLAVSHIKVILFTMMMVYVIWPMIVIFYLTYPGVKDFFVMRKEHKAPR